mmetsp:Transcript_27183/g.87850  ORF Transcript_27183/g.87850 Transcript_27183/m.87850 type:complete len:124 (+) Transcript_27183:42-413(+)
MMLLSRTLCRPFARRQASSAAGLAAYRKLLRTRGTVFRGDDYAMRQTRDEIRRHFEENRGEADGERLAALFRDVDDVEDLLRNNVVQARQNDRGNFELKVPPQSSSSSPTNASCAEALRPIEE